MTIRNIKIDLSDAAQWSEWRNSNVPLPSFEDYLIDKKPTNVLFGEFSIFGRNGCYVVINHLNAINVFDRTEIPVFHYFESMVSPTRMESMPAAVILNNASKRCKDKLPNSKIFLLINADEDTDFRPEIGLVELGLNGYPVVSFECIHEMLDTGSKYSLEDTINALTNGRLKIIDFQPDKTIPLAKSEKQIVNRCINKGGYKHNYGLIPPELGYTVVKLEGVWVWHMTGAVLLYDTEIDASYLFGQDEGTYFGCHICDNPKSVAQAFQGLIPKEIWNRDYLLRQGEWFVVPVAEEEVPKFADCSGMASHTNSYSSCFWLPVLSDDDNHHDVKSHDIRVSKIDGLVYAKDMQLEHNDHANVSYEGWCKFVRNTAIRSVSQEGVD